MTIDLDNLILLAIALANVVTAYMAWSTRVIAKQTEINTNSMKDALVASTKIASHGEGLAEGIAKGVEKAAALEQGRQEGAAEIVRASPEETKRPILINTKTIDTNEITTDVIKEGPKPTK